MSKLIYIFSFISLILFFCSPVKSDKDKERINSVCDKFMQNFLEEDIEGAMKLLKANSVLAHSTIDTTQATIINQMREIFPNYGKALSYEFISERKIKDFISKRFYLLRFEKYYLKFDFTLYNTGKNWLITNFNYNDDLIEILY